MALVLDDTLGGANSNTFLSLADANTLSESDFNATLWTDATDDKKNIALVQATKRLCQESYYGTRTNPTQALCFPREDLPSIDGVDVNGIIPNQIKDATYYLAKYIINGTDIYSSEVNEQIIKKEKVGDLETEYAVNTSGDFISRSNELPSFITSFITDLSSSSSDTVFVPLTRG